MKWYLIPIMAMILTSCDNQNAITHRENVRESETMSYSVTNEKSFEKVSSNSADYDIVNFQLAVEQNRYAKYSFELVNKCQNKMAISGCFIASIGNNTQRELFDEILEVDGKKKIEGKVDMTAITSTLRTEIQSSGRSVSVAILAK